MKYLIAIAIVALSNVTMAAMSCTGSSSAENSPIETVKLKLVENESSANLTVYEGKLKDVEFIATNKTATNENSLLINMKSLGFAISGTGPSASQPKAYIDAGTAAGASFTLKCKLE
jgi:hypothetical protein